MMRQILSSIVLLSLSFVANAQYSHAEEKMGETVFKSVKRTQGIYENEAALAWVEDIGRRLEKEIEGDYVFQYHLIDVEEPNAFATGGGYVFVTRGLLAIVNNEDELACILAHEITHVTQRHSVKSVRASILPAILELPADIIGLLTYKEIGNFINLPIELSSQLVISAYTRSHEREADKLGVQLALRAGFDPYALPIVLQKLEDFVVDFYDSETKYSLLNDHPLTEDRVVYLDKEIMDLGIDRKPVIPGTKVMALDGLVFGQNANLGFVEDNLFCHPGERLLCQFPADWTVQNAAHAVSAESADGKAQILLTLDKHTGSPVDAARDELRELNHNDLISQGSLRINGLQAYQVKLRKRRVKYSDYLSTFTWIKIPSSGIMVRMVGLSLYKKPDTSIDTCIQSFRMLNYDELLKIEQTKIKLVEASSLDSYPFESSEERKEAELINQIPEGAKLAEGEYLKVLVKEPWLKE